MKTKLLKKLRKQAHDKYRIVPDLDNTWSIEIFLSYSDYPYWRLVDYAVCISTLEETIKHITALREEEFNHIARREIDKRKYNKRFEQVKNL